MARAKRKKRQQAQNETLGSQAIEAHQAGDFARAEKLYRLLLTEHPDNAPLLASLGQACLDQNRFEEAIGYLEKSLRIDGSNARVIYNLGLCHHRINDHGQAIHFYEQALAREPGLCSAHINLAAIHYMNQAYSDAIFHLEKVIELDPSEAKAMGNLAITYAETGQIDKALALARRALQADPSLHSVHSNYLLDLHYDPEIDAQTLFEEHLQWARRHGQLPRFEHKKLNTTDRRLRIAYLSPDFKVHSVAYFFVPLLKSHDAERFEIFCYSDTSTPDELTEHLKTLSHHWRDTHRLTDDELCQRIRQDKIDILVDLAGHTAYNRMKALARKPAPIQVTYLGYPDTTGLDTMDYRITDAWADPPGHSEQWHTETLLRLKHGFLCYQPPVNVPDITPPPCERNGFITFGSFNNLKKINRHVVELWAKILLALPNSRLLLKSKGLALEETRQRYLHLFEKQGIAPERIEILPYTKSMLEHMAQYQRVDIALDSFPYNGTTTTCEALWMGVPVIVLEGDRHLSRVGVSIMQQAGLVDLIAGSEDHYCQLAVELARQPEALRHLRQNLREHLRHSRLTDAESMIRDVEEAYAHMWQHYLDPDTDDNRPSRQAPADACVLPHVHSDDQALHIQFHQARFSAPLAELPPSISAPLEQQAWFQPDARVLARILEHSQTIIDMAAEIGVFSRFAADNTPAQARILAREEHVLLRNHLASNIANLDKVILLDENRPLSEITAGQSVDLIRFSSLAQMEHFLHQDESLLIQQLNALLVITPEDHLRQASGALTTLRQWGYKAFRLAPGLACLIPVIFDETSPAEERCSLFLCKPERAQRLALQGVLIPSLDDIPTHTAQAGGWAQALKQLPYARPYIDEWHDRRETQPHAHEYHQALAHYTEAMHPEQTPAWRYGRLLEAFQGLVAIIDYHPSLPRLLSLARMASDLGLRDNACEVLNLLFQHVTCSESLDFNETFLAPSAYFDRQDPGERLAEWCLAAIIDALEHNRASNVLASTQEDLERLELFERLGFQSERVQQRLAVLQWQQAQLQSSAAEHTVDPRRVAERPVARPELAIVYHLARSGGTLISKCLACIEGNLLLSEIHPIVSVADPLDQACQWFELFSTEEAERLKRELPDYQARIRIIEEKARQLGQKLILRDWSHIDFIGVPFVDHPSYRLTQSELLQDEFGIRQIATVRHPIDTFLSLSKLAIMQGRLDIDHYLKGFRQFALKAREMGFIRYEDFCAEPHKVLRHICNVLGINYQDDFVNRFAQYAHITGERNGGRSGDKITIPAPRPLPADIRERFESNMDYWEALSLLGYSHPLA